MYFHARYIISLRHNSILTLLKSAHFLKSELILYLMHILTHIILFIFYITYYLRCIVSIPHNNYTFINNY